MCASVTLANKPIGEWRELYDLWVECGEQVFAQVAHSEAYGKLQAELGNAAMRLRAQQQTIFEYALRQFDLPTRSELNTVHRQVRRTARAGWRRWRARRGNSANDPRERASDDRIAFTTGRRRPSWRRSRSACRAASRRWRASATSRSAARRRMRSIAKTNSSCIATGPSRDAAGRRVRTPLLICYALVNRPYMMDLQPDRSLIRGSAATRSRCLSDRLGLSGRRRSLSRIRGLCARATCRTASIAFAKSSGVERLNLLGVCQGGTLSLCYAALYPEQDPQPHHDGDAGRFSYAGEPADEVDAAHRRRCAGCDERQRAR